MYIPERGVAAYEPSAKERAVIAYTPTCGRSDASPAREFFDMLGIAFMVSFVVAAVTVALLGLVVVGVRAFVEFPASAAVLLMVCVCAALVVVVSLVVAIMGAIRVRRRRKLLDRIYDEWSIDHKDSFTAFVLKQVAGPKLAIVTEDVAEWVGKHPDVAHNDLLPIVRDPLLRKMFAAMRKLPGSSQKRSDIMRSLERECNEARTKTAEQDTTERERVREQRAAALKAEHEAELEATRIRAERAEAEAVSLLEQYEAQHPSE